MAEQYPEELASVLASECDFYQFLEEHENLTETSERLQSISVTHRGKAIIESRTDSGELECDTIDVLFKQDQLSPSERSSLLGEMAQQAGRYDEAEQLYRNVLSVADRQEDCYALRESLIHLFLEQKQYARALAVTKEFSSDSPLREYTRGRVKYNQGDRQEALDIFRAALHPHPRNLSLLKIITHLLRQVHQIDNTTSRVPRDTSELEEAIAYAERLEDILPSPEHTILRAYLLSMKRHFEDALSLLSKVEKDEYYTYRSGRLKAEILWELERFQDSAEEWAVLREEYGYKENLQFYEGLAWEKSGDLDRAICIWEDALSHDQIDGNLYLKLGQSYIIRGATDPTAFSRAFDLFEEAIEKFPDRHEFPALLFQAGEGCGRGTEA